MKYAMRKILVFIIMLEICLCFFRQYGYCADITDDPIIYSAKGKRDPFVSLIGQEKNKIISLEGITSIDELTLEGIAIGAGGKQVAILNGQMVKDNDKFGSLVVKKISRKSVLVSIDGKDYSLNIQEQEGSKGGK